MAHKQAWWKSPWIAALVAVGGLAKELLDDTNRAQFLTVGFGVFILGIIVMAIELNTRIRSLEQQLDQRALCRGIAKQLSILLSAASGLQDVLKRVPAREIEEWDKRVEAYVMSEPLLGQSYMSRLRKGSAVPITIPDELKPLDMTERRQAWCRVHTRCARLIEFIDEMEDRATR